MKELQPMIQALVDETPRVQNWGSLILNQYEQKDVLDRWVQKGYHAGLTYMENNLTTRSNPRHLKPWGKSILLFTLDYPTPLRRTDSGGLKIASYARGRDYHFDAKEFLQKLKSNLSQVFEREEEVLDFLPFVDTLPVFERDLAVEMGLGWAGKNCVTLHRQQGSGFFLFGCLVDFELEVKHISPPSCGTCDRCLVACPTGAFVEPGVIDSSKCISYWTIEHKGEIPEDIAQKFDGWIFGCDICQDVCPWNSAHKQELPGDVFDRDHLGWLLLLRKGGGFKAKFKHTPLARAGRKMMLRNVLISVRNSRDQSVASFIHRMKEEEEAFLQGEIEKTLKTLQFSEDESM